jgi:hypothetical protein
MVDTKRTVFIPFGTKPIADMTLGEIINELNHSREGLHMLKREVEILRALLVDEIVGVTMKPRQEEVLDKPEESVVDSKESSDGEGETPKKGNFQA